MTADYLTPADALAIGRHAYRDGQTVTVRGREYRLSKRLPSGRAFGHYVIGLTPTDGKGHRRRFCAGAEIIDTRIDTRCEWATRKGRPFVVKLPVGFRDFRTVTEAAIAASAAA